MKIGVISYSLTGNNKALADSLAAALGAEHVRITEAKQRTMGKIVGDLLLNRTPPVQFDPGDAERFDLVLFVGPVWIGQVPSPFRACFKQLRAKIGAYGYVSISGGADGPNPKLAGELAKRLRKEPATVIDLHIADLLPPEPKPERKDTSAYHLSDVDIRNLTETVTASLRQTIGALSPAS